MQFTTNDATRNKQYRVKGIDGVDTVITILRDLGSAYSIHLTSHSPLGTSESEEVLSKDLFSSCLRTGYLQEISAQILTIA